jgi:hypothetical protein
MLLHVIEAALPVDFGVDFSGRDRGVEDMSHAVFLIDYLDDVRSAQLSSVEGLATGGGIESGAVQIDAPAVAGGFDHTSAKFLEVAVLIVKALSHGVMFTGLEK